MSLSRIQQDRGDITTFQLLLRMATSLETLISDPKALQKAAEEAFSLSDENEKKAMMAYANIANAESATQEAKKQQEIATNLIEESKKAKAEAEAQADIIRKERKRLASDEENQGAFALKLNNQAADLADRESKLVAGQDDLKKQLAALAEKQKQFNADVEALKAKTEKLRSIVGE